MKEFVSTLEKLVKLADDWKYYSHSIYGLSSQTYEKDDMRVWCYFSNNSNHSSVHIGEFDITYFNPIRFNCFTINNVQKLSSEIIKYRKYLNKLRKEQKAKSKEEIDTDKKARIIKLKSELKELNET